MATDKKTVSFTLTDDEIELLNEFCETLGVAKSVGLGMLIRGSLGNDAPELLKSMFKQVGFKSKKTLRKEKAIKAGA